MTSPFPIGSSVLLQNLIKGAHLNDKKGIVKSNLIGSTGRQEVYIFQATKSISIKPTNMRYEPRDLASLSASEMKGILMLSKQLKEEPTEWSGLDKEALRQMVVEGGEVAMNDPEEIAELVARANEPKEVPSSSGAVSSSSSSGNAGKFNSSQLRQGAERMGQMTPDGIRQQAATMKAMGPAALRAMNPQMAGMNDAQINMAIEQMEAVANNPSHIKMAAEQMKNMSEGELNRAMNQSPLAGSSSSATAATSSGTATAPQTTNNISQSQFQHATQQMATMTPAQLKQQAAVLKSTPLATLRRTNPQMANMTDAQIQMSILQLEQMAENPEMVKMASDQMKNMTEEQYESMQKMMGGGGAASSTSSAGTSATTSANDNTTAPALGGIDMANLPTDPTKMMEALLSNPTQLNSIVKTMKQNPEMMKQMMSSQMGGGGGKASNAQNEQIKKAIDSFSKMDDTQLERYLKVANGVQKVAKPMLTVFVKVKETLGISSKVLIVMINLMLFAVIFGFVRWWRNGGGVMVEDPLAGSGEEAMPEMAASHGDGEF